MPTTVTQGTSGNDTLTGGADRDMMYGGAGDDTLDGGAGNDVLYGGEGSDTLIGGDGDDQMTGGEGADLMIGGAGNDTYFVENAGDVLVELAGEGNDTVVSYLANYKLLDNFEYLNIAEGAAVDGAGRSNGRGNESANTIKGSSTANSIRGEGGNDTVYSYGGDDIVDGGTGDDLLDGGTGVDTLVFKGTYVTGGVTVDLAITGKQNTGFGLDTIRNFENVEGTAFNDTLLGTSGANKISALGGDDSIRGRGGDDDISLGSGADKVYFDGTATNGFDTIKDFATGIDSLIFSSSMGYASGAAFETVSSAGGGSVEATVAGPVFVFDTNLDVLYYDADGAGGAAAVALATVQGAGGVAAGDIVVL